MDVYSETLDPAETKDFAVDWTPQLGDGETIISQAVAFIDPAGTSNPVNTFTPTASRVWLTGGTHGLRAIFTVTVITSSSPARTLEAALAVDVVSNTIGVDPAQSEIARVKAELASLYVMRAKIVAGEAITQLWRDGRRVSKAMPTLKELNDHIRTLENELAAANAAAAGTPRRRAIGLAWSN